MRAVAVMIGAVVLAVTAGCGADPVPRSAELPALPAGAKPFDLYRHADVTVIERADLKLFLDCLADHGYPQERELSSGPGVAASALLRPAISPRTEAAARRYGFGAAEAARPALITRKEPAFQETAARCESAARAPLGDSREVSALRSRYADLGNAMVQTRAKRSQEMVVAYSNKITSCLVGAGYRLKSGDKFNPRGDLAQYGIKAGVHVAVAPARTVRPAGLPADAEFQPAVPAREYRPSKAEVAFALAFVRCGTSTGLFAALDQAEIPMQQEIVERHVSEFSGLNPRIEALAAKAADVLRAP
ncbi:hypothetical protein AB0P21_38005 [Kribbella sp. NPDC056861]|uniref:hypothetical protein n=1 Tax=Kribbella sp. NPDC056861 TaxID=3154857 RepID=UPI00343A5002